MSCHVTAYHVLSYHVSCHVISRLVTSCHVTPCHFLSCHVMSCHVESHVTHIYTCHVTAYHVLSYHVIMSRIFLPSLLNSSIMAAGWPRRGFRSHGPVRESGSEQRSPCGAAGTASVRVWRRAHFCRVRVAGCGDRACLRHVFACACDAVHIFVAFAWQAAGIECVGGMLRTCRRHAAAVPWGLVLERALHTHGERAFRFFFCRWRLKGRSGHRSPSEKRQPKQPN